MELYLCRHAQTLHNEKNVVQGHQKSEISQEGKEQVEKLRSFLDDKNVSAIYSSSLNRALETAEVVAEPHRFDVISSERLKEVGRGRFEGESFEDLIEEIESSDEEDYLWKPDGGESLEDARERVEDFLEEIKDRHQEDTVVAISHGGAIRAGLMSLIDHSTKNSYFFSQDNCCVNKISWKDERGWRIHSVNDTCHL